MHRHLCACCCCRTDLDALCDQIVSSEPLVSEGRRPQLRRLLLKLVEKQVCVRCMSNEQLY